MTEEEYGAQREVVAPAEYWTLPADDLMGSLGGGADGLSSGEAIRRVAQFGPNTVEAREKTTPLLLFLKKFKDPIILILLFATIVSAVIQEWVDASIIIAIVLGSAFLSFTQEYRASSAIERLRARITLKSTVLRDNRPQEVLSSEVVPGDVVLLSAGNLVPADAVLLDARDCYVNQAVLTGETFPTQKNPGPVNADATLAERTNCVFMGTNVRSGSAKALVVKTGASTMFGRIAGQLSLRPPETEFEHGIRRLGYFLMRIMVVLVLIVFGANVFFNKPVLDSLLFSVAMAVGLTPQLLPAIISVTLARGSRQMAEHDVIVRRLESIENFGSMDILCTDKTGTLTAGVVKLDNAMDIHGQPSEDLFRYVYLNAYFESGIANPLDEAILAAGSPDVSGYGKVDEIPYDFVRKRLGVVVGAGGDAPVLITKGALESVLSVCEKVEDKDRIVPLGNEYRDSIMEKFSAWSSKGFRVLGVATRELQKRSRYTRKDEIDMIFRGFIILSDPPKPGVTETVNSLEDLGVRLKIITGDNRLVTLHIAEALGIAVTGMLTGAEIDNMSDEALWTSTESVNLFAEVDPNQKERIILAHKKLGHTVGYMGDGINDAPALHSADVGISVDTAVDVAKEAADFVLLKRDLAVLHQGIVLGRATFANTMKYIFTTISANFGNMFSMAGASFILPFLPLLPMQVLLTNFLSDFPMMNIAGDRVDEELVRKPQRWNIKFLRKFMITFGLVSSVFDYLTFGVLLLIFKVGQDMFRTSWFVESVITELLVVFIVRTRKPFFRSRPGRLLMITSLVVFVVTIAVPYSPIHRVLGLTPLPLPILAALLILTAFYIGSVEITKRFFYRSKDA